MTADFVRVRGHVAQLSDEDRDTLLSRNTDFDDVLRDTVGAIIELVRREGDTALRSLAREYDNVFLTKLEVPMSKCEQAWDALDPALRQALERAARNISTVHRAMLPTPIVIEPEPGVIVARQAEPLGSVGVYVPGGKAAYPSSVLMSAIPARVAGVQDVIVCSPPRKNGLPSPVVLAACALAGVDRVFALGGAGAVAAMAYGTESVPQVDRIVGPGNAFVAEAKLQVSRVVGIDSPAGPSEILIIADDSCDPATVARELIAQAEHDEDACCVAVLIGSGMVERVEQSLRAQAAATTRKGIVTTSLARRGALLQADSILQAAAFATLFAPEHLLVATRENEEALRHVRRVGTVFIDPTSSVAFGDYMTGANHVLPTGGLARSYSGLSTLDFMRWVTIQRVSPAAAAALAADVEVLAMAEGLDGHARAAAAWANGSVQ